MTTFIAGGTNNERGYFESREIMESKRAFSVASASWRALFSIVLPHDWAGQPALEPAKQRLVGVITGCRSARSRMQNRGRSAVRAARKTSHLAFTRAAITSPASKARSPLKLSRLGSPTTNRQRRGEHQGSLRIRCAPGAKLPDAGENYQVRRRYTVPYGDHHDNTCPNRENLPASRPRFRHVGSEPKGPRAGHSV